MKTTVTLALLSLLSAAPSTLWAKGVTTKIVIEGPDLSKPIEITDRTLLADFNVWAGPGTSCTQPGFNVNAPSFIVDWSQGRIGPVPSGLAKYQVSFYSGERSKRLIYVVYYAIPAGPAPGYVHLPGSSDEGWRVNVRSIWRGVEGQWFRAWSAWENLARPLIERARSASAHPG